MGMSLGSRLALAFALIGAATIIGFASSASANPPTASAARTVAFAAVIRPKTPSVQGSEQTHVGQVSIKGVGSTVGATTPLVVRAGTSNPSTNPTPTVDSGMSPGIVRGGGSIVPVLPGSMLTGGPQDFIVTATVAQSSDVSTGTFIFGDDGATPDLEAAPLVPQTAKEAGLDGVVAPNASGNSSITGTVAGAVTAADGSRRMAIDLYGDKLLSFAVDPKAGVKIVSTTASTLGSSEKAAGIALGEPITLLASVARDIVRSTINLTGIRQANGFLLRDGHLVLVFVDKDR